MAADVGWLGVFGAALGGGLTVKLLDILYQEIRYRSDRKRTAKKFVDEHLDPLLKASDELVGKLRSLAEQDFSGLRKITPKNITLESAEFASLLYLFARFWAQVEILRRQGLSVAMSEDPRGNKLQNLLSCLESRRIRVVDRIAQRAVGEVMLREQHGVQDSMPFILFVKTYETDESARHWLQPLVTVLSRVGHTRERQLLLQYGIVLHALIDTLDPKHLLTRSRPSFPGKLTKESRQELNYRVFGQYLTFVKDREKYLGPPKRRPQAKK
ncbi:MAG: hypothetical protein HYY78_11785 [Betaproteobacteria bacterium]|nr:hypothetical protein [Betaproteobacteria bacterium]